MKTTNNSKDVNDDDNWDLMIDNIMEGHKGEETEDNPPPLTKCGTCDRMAIQSFSHGNWYVEFEGVDYTDRREYPDHCYFCIPEQKLIKNKEQFENEKKSSIGGYLYSIKKLYRDSRLNQFDTNTEDAVKTFLKGDEWLLYLFGNTGTGKTYLSNAAAIQAYTNYTESDDYKKKFLEHYKDSSDRLYYMKDPIAGETTNKPRVWNFSNLALKARADAIDKGITIEDLATTEDLVILDDMGKEKQSEFLNQQLYYLINSRYENQLKTIISSNFSLVQLSTNLDQALVSRLSTGKIIELKGQDRRFDID